MSVFAVILVSIFPHSDQNNSEYGQFLGSANVFYVTDYVNLLFSVLLKLNGMITEVGKKVFYKNSCSYKFRKTHIKTPVPESLF